MSADDDKPIDLTANNVLLAQWTFPARLEQTSPTSARVTVLPPRLEPVASCPGSGARIIYDSTEVVCSCGRTLTPEAGRVPVHAAPESSR